MLKTENQTKVYIHFEDHWKHSSHKTKRRQHQLRHTHQLTPTQIRNINGDYAYVATMLRQLEANKTK